MLTQEQLQAIKAPLPPEAFSGDTSRGLRATPAALLGRTSGSASWQRKCRRIRGGSYVIERLNEVFGTCGVGSRYVHSGFEELVTERGHVEIVTEVALHDRPQS